ncbi:MAG: SAM-dependent methyltransferase [Sodaliphilus sp.]
MAIDAHDFSEELWRYVAINAQADTAKLMLKSEPDLPFSKRFAVMQIECRRKAKHKIPSLLANPHFTFPKSISAEQCTHEAVAKFHASLFRASDHVLDMTMGLGVDAHFISQRVKSLRAIELDPDIALAGAHNYDFEVICHDSVEWLKHSQEQFDAIFIDPARRADSGARLYGLQDCAPDVPANLPLLKAHTRRLFIKASPMIDVTQTMRTLAPHLTDVWAVSVKNECKELLLTLDFSCSCTNVALHAIDFATEIRQFSTSAEALAVEVAYASPSVGAYLYEPNAAVMKIGTWGAIARDFGVDQVAQNSHLFVSDSLLPDFPGRTFVVKEILPFSSKIAKTLRRRYPQMNVATRNFRLSAEALKKQLKVTDGGSHYLFATTLHDTSQVLLITQKP